MNGWEVLIRTISPWIREILSRTIHVRYIRPDQEFNAYKNLQLTGPLLQLFAQNSEGHVVRVTKIIATILTQSS